MDNSTARWLTPPPLQRLNVRWLVAFAYAAITLVFWFALSKPRVVDSSIILSIVGCAVIYAIVGLITGRVTSERYSVLRSVPVFAVYLCGGTFPAIATAYLGALFHNFIRTTVSPHFRLDRFTISHLLLNVIYDGGMSSAATLMGGAAYILFGSSPPLQELSSVTIPSFVAFVLVTFGALYIPWHFAEPVERRQPAAVMRRILQAQVGFPIALIHTLGFAAGNWHLLFWIILDGSILVTAYVFARLEALRSLEADSIRMLLRERATERALATRITLPELGEQIYTFVKEAIVPPSFALAVVSTEGQRVNYPYRIENGQLVSAQPNEFIKRVVDFVIQKRIPLLGSEASYLQLGLKPDDPADAPLCIAAVPMMMDSGVVGVLLAYDWRNARAFNPTQLESLRHIGEQSASMVRNASLYTRVFEMADSLALLNNVSAVVSATLDLETVLETISNIITEVGHADRTGIFLANDTRTAVVLEYSVGLSSEFVGLFAEQSGDQLGGPKQMLQHWTSLAITDVFEDPRALGWRSLAEVEGYRSMLIVPLIASDKVIGFMAAFYDQLHQFEQSELDLMNTLANQVAVTVSNARLHQDTQNRTRELANLVDVSRAFTSTLDLDGVLENVLDALDKAVSPTAVVLAEARSLLVGMPLTILAQRGLAPEHHHQIVATETINQVLTLRRPELLADSVPDFELLRKLNLEVIYTIPMVNQDEAFGLALIGYSTRQALDGRRRQLAEAILNQAATAIRNAQLFSQVDEALDARVNELVAIETLSRKISASLDSDEIIEEALKIVQRVTNADLAAFAAPLNSDPSYIKLVQQFSTALNSLPVAAIMPRATGVINEVLLSGQTIQLGDVRDYPGYMPSGIPEVRSELAVPVKYKGETLGVLNLESRRLDAFTGSHRSFVLLLSEHVGVAINNARLFIERQTQLENLIQLRNMSLRLLDAKTLKDANRLIVQFTLTIMKARDVHLYTYNEVTEQLNFAASVWSDGREDIEARQPSPDGRTWRVARTGQMLLISDVAKEPSPSTGMDDNTYGAIARVPIKRGEQVFGVLVLTFRDPQFFDDGKVRTLDLIASQSAVAIGSVTLFEEVKTKRDQMQVIFDSARDGMALLDSTGTLLLVNKAAERMFGLSLQNMTGRRIFRLLAQARRSEQLPLDAASAAAHDQPPPGKADGKYTQLAPMLLRAQSSPTSPMAQGIDDLLTHIKRQPNEPTRRTYSVNITGGMRDVEEVTLPVLDEEGRLAGRLIVMRDISEEKAEERFREEVQDILIHDLRAPTGNMLTTLQLMVELIHMEEYKELANVTNIAIEGAERLLNLINQLLDLAKAAELTPAEYSPYAMVQKAVNSLQATARDASITVLNNVPEDLATVFVDEGKITRVFINLLDNALRHTPVNGEVRFEASLITQRDGDYVRISVTDSGKGIPEEYWPKIFQKFVQVKGSALRGHKGAGLGLTFCQKIVEAHGGKIWVNRGESGGAAFWLTLPVARRESPLVAAPQVVSPTPQQG